MKPKEVVRFWAKVDQSGECWLWTGGRFQSGYGQVKLDGRHQRAHRISYVLAGNDLPAGHVVHHCCRNRACVNPAHLRAILPGQHYAAETEARGCKQIRRLTREDVEEILRRRIAGESCKAVAAVFGIHFNHVSRISNGKAWAELANPAAKALKRRVRQHSQQ